MVYCDHLCAGDIVIISNGNRDRATSITSVGMCLIMYIPFEIYRLMRPSSVPAGRFVLHGLLNRTLLVLNYLSYINSNHRTVPCSNGSSDRSTATIGDQEKSVNG